MKTLTILAATLVLVLSASAKDPKVYETGTFGGSHSITSETTAYHDATRCYESLDGGFSCYEGAHGYGTVTQEWFTIEAPEGTYTIEGNPFSASKPGDVFHFRIEKGRMFILLADGKELKTRFDFGPRAKVYPRNPTGLGNY